MKTRKPLSIFNEDLIDAEAKRLFRILNGPGDSGSEGEYHCQNPALIDSWERLAVEFLKLKQTGKSALRDEAVTKMIRDISEEPEGTPEQKHEKGAGV